MAHDFPGNVRELENIIEYATVVCKNSHVGIEHLPDHIRSKVVPDTHKHLEKGSSWQDLERHFLYETLRKNEWNRIATAAQLGIHPTTLWRKIKRLNIEVPKGTKKSDNILKQ